MNSSTIPLEPRLIPAARPGSSTGPLPFLWFLLVSLVAVSAGSFWIDEFVTARYAAWPSLHDAWKDMVRIKTAEVQMPFYMVYVWLYEKAFGTGEWALRFSTVPWLVVGMTALTVSLRNRGLGVVMIIVLGISPFVWYYQNEARLYAMQLGATALVVAALFGLCREPEPSEQEESFWAHSFVAGISLLSAISMLGMIWASSALLAALFLLRGSRLWKWWRKRRILTLFLLAVLTGLGFYYLWSVKAGARATSVATTNLQTVAFVFYETLGFAGLGPGRAELREVGVSSLKPFLPILLCYVATVSIFLIAGVREMARRSSWKTIGILAGCLIFPAAFLLSTGVIMQFRVLGRHFSPLVVVFLITLAFGGERFWKNGGLARRGLVVVFVGLALASCLSLRFGPRHAKDDYRSAAVIANEVMARGGTVWWNAEEIGAQYYGLSTSRAAASVGQITCLINPQPGFTDKLERPHVIIASKPDIYDAAGTVAAYLVLHGYRLETVLPAFKVWRRND